MRKENDTNHKTGSYSVARNIDDIQREIERTRRQLAKTLDEIANRAKPQHMVEDAKESLITKLKDPQTQKILAGVTATVVGLVAITVVRVRRQRADVRELKELLASR